MITPALHNAFVKFGPLFRGDLIERTVYPETGNLPFSLFLPSPSSLTPLSSRPLLCPPLSFSSRDRFLEVVHNEFILPRYFVPYIGARSPMHYRYVRTISACVSLCRYENIACQVTRLLCNQWIAGD